MSAHNSEGHLLRCALCPFSTPYSARILTEHLKGAHADEVEAGGGDRLALSDNVVDRRWKLDEIVREIFPAFSLDDSSGDFIYGDDDEAFLGSGDDED